MADATSDVETGFGPQFASLLVRLGAFAAFAVVLIYFALTARGFTSSFNIVNVFEQSAILTILAYGMTVVFVGTGTDVQKGGIDLSIAANAGLCAAVFALLLRNGYGDGVAALTAILTGMLVGCLNAIAVANLRIQPLLATLAVLNIAAGLELTITENTVVTASSDFLTGLQFNRVLGLSWPVWILSVFSVILFAAVHFTPMGLRLYASGSFPEAARAAGINVKRNIIGSYVFAGFCAGFASILIVARLSASTPGTGLLLLPILAASLLGTVFSRRFLPTIGGTLLAALFVGFLVNGFQLSGISSFWVNGAQGALILFVVAVTYFAKSKGS